MSIKRWGDLIVFSALAWAGFTLADREAGKRGRRLVRKAPGRVRMAPAPAGDHPGRTAETLLEISRGGWLQIGKRVLGQIVEDRVLAEAAAVTFYTLLALFPAIAALISLYGLVADPATIEKHLSMVSGVVPDGGMQIITAQIHSLAAAGHKALGFGAIAGLFVSLWSASAGVRALFDALNAVYEEKEQRGFFRRVLVSLAFTLGGLLFVVLAVGAIVAIPVVLDYAGLKSSTDLLLSVARWPILLAAVTFMLAMIYRFGPSRARAKWRWVSWGSGVAAVVWVLASAGFSWYAANFGTFNRTYGSLGAAVGFMTWIWISTIILLIGAELNAEMERQTEADPTAGPATPAGTSGAQKMAECAE
jgi:membrane protein